MVAAVSVVVTGKNFRSELDGLVESLDSQSLPSEAFELLVVDSGSSDGTRERLRLLANRRPNIRLLELDDDGGSSATGFWVQQCEGDYVLRLQPGQQLFPEALERLVAFARTEGVDVVCPRAVIPGTAVPSVFLTDATELDQAPRGEALAASGVLVRRSLISSGTDSESVDLLEAARVGVLSSYPVVTQTSSDRGASDPLTIRQDSVSISWNADRLRVEASGAVVDVPAASLVDLEGTFVLGLLRHTSGLTFLLGEGSLLVRPFGQGSGAEWLWELSADLDLSTAAAGGALPSGVWEVDLQLKGGTAPCPPVALRWAPCPPAVIGRTVVVPAPVELPIWQLDVGPTQWPLVGAPDPADAKVTESAAGSLLVLQLPQVHVDGAEVIDGEIHLDRLALPAKVITEDHSARLEAFVSGLAGSPKIATQFGEVAAKPTGLRLNISGVGFMQVAKVAPAARKPTAAPSTPPQPAPVRPTKPTAKKAKKKPAPKPLTKAQHLRHALPSGLEPLAKRVAKNPQAQRLYRKLARL